MLGTCINPVRETRRRSAICAVIAATFAATIAVAAAPRAEAAPVEVVVRAATGSLGQVATSVRAAGGHIDRELRALDELTARVPADAVAPLRAAPGVTSVTANHDLHLTADGYDPSTDAGSYLTTTRIIGARDYYEAGFLGAGVDVALIDSGVAPVPGLDAAGKIVNGPDLSFESQSTSLRHLDTFGHGTHLAGIIAGRDADPTNPDYFAGIAPASRLVSVKVADAYGNTDVSQVLAAIDWVVEHRTDNGLNIRVLNLSFGTDAAQDPTVDPLCHAVEVAWRNGITVVAAAGNGGTATGHLSDPAIDRFVIAVGAEDPHGTQGISDDTVTDFSSRGDGTRNPTVVAPGKSLVSLRDPGSSIDVNHPEGRVGSRYFRGSGTSQAAAVVSGSVALIAQQHPTYTPDEIKAAITTTTKLLPSGGPATAQGRGLINLSGASRSNTAGNHQTYTQSNGRGTLEGSRGSLHLLQDGVRLDGERDIFGAGYDTTSQSSLEENLAAWDGGTFNGSSWSGSSWSGSSWSDATWTGSSWSGSSWSSSSWSGNAWTGSSWYGSGWQGSSWSITGLAGAGWSTSEWQ